MDRTIDTKKNKEFSKLILENKLDFNNEKFTIKSLNLKDSESLESYGETDANSNMTKNE